MARHPRASGFTLLEAIVAMTVLLIGSLGLVSLHAVGVRMNGDARVMTRATEIAQDLATQMQTWNYNTDARLTKLHDWGDYADEAFAYERGSFTYDYTEADLASGPWSGIASDTVQALGFTRYWNVQENAADADENGRVRGKRIAIIVRWSDGGRSRRIVLLTYLPDPQVAN